MAIANVDIGPSSAVANSDCSRPHQIAKYCYSINERSAFEFANLIHRHCFSSNGGCPICSESECFIGLVLRYALKTIDKRILLSQLCIQCLFLLLWQLRVHVIGASTLQ